MLFSQKIVCASFYENISNFWCRCWWCDAAAWVFSSLSCFSFFFLDTDTSKLGRDICATVFFRFPGASSSAFPRFPSGAFNNAPFLCARHVKALHFGQLAMGAKWGMERRFDSSARKSWLTYLVDILSLPWRWFYGIFPRLFLCKTRASLAKKKKGRRDFIKYVLEG